jgi:hypothetical protein
VLERVTANNGGCEFVFELLLELGADLFVTTVTGDGAESVKAGRRFAVGCLVLIV